MWCNWQHGVLPSHCSGFESLHPHQLYRCGVKDNMNCLNCGKETTNPKYCSKSCSATHTNILYPKRKTKKKCSVCGEPVKNYRTRFCEVHLEDYKFNRYRDKTLGEYQSKDSVKDKHPSWVNAHVRSFARSWNKILTDLPCAVCGYDKHVELAHIKAVSEFNVSDKLSDINNERNIIQLC